MKKLLPLMAISLLLAWCSLPAWQQDNQQIADLQNQLSWVMEQISWLNNQIQILTDENNKLKEGIANNTITEIDSVTWSISDRYWKINSNNYTISLVKDKTQEYKWDNFTVYKITKTADNRRCYIVEFSWSLKEFAIQRYKNMMNEVYNYTDKEIRASIFQSIDNKSKIWNSIWVAVDETIVVNENNNWILAIVFDDPSWLQNNMSYEDLKEFTKTLSR